MLHSVDYNEHECNHVIDVTICDSSSSLASQGEFNCPNEMQNEDRLSISSLATATRLYSSATTTSRSASLRRSGENRGLGRRNPLDSGLWISVMLFANVTQIVAAVVVLSFSKHEYPQAPLFAWVVGYTVGCVVNLPRLYWRYIHSNDRAFDQESASTHQHFSYDSSAESIAYAGLSVPDMEGSIRHGTSSVSRSSQDILVSNSRLSSLIVHFKMALECFFVVWFVVGNVWVFGSHSSAADAPNLYRLCIAFLAFSCIGYAMPFILCLTICCCFPCIISVLGFREDFPITRGATSELINALQIYKFKPQRSQSRGSKQTRVGKFEGGILAAGTDKERNVSCEDAACCICLATYAENEEVRELPCAHFFHAGCVDRWLKFNALCPLCKSTAVPPPGLSALLSSLLNNADPYRSLRRRPDVAEDIV